MKLLMTIAIAAAVLVCGAGPQAAEITLGASGPMREALSLLAPVFARKTGHKIEILYASDAEARAATARGEDVDAAIVASPFESVLGSAHVLADSRTDLARVRLGMAVRSKAPRPDVSTPDALRRTLLESQRIVFPDSGGAQAGVIFEKIIAMLGVASELAPKLRRVRGGPAAMVALPREEADLGVAFVSEILPEPGVDFIGVAPQALDPGADYTGFVLARSKQPQAARELLTFLASPEAAAIYATVGMTDARAAAALP